MTKTASSWSSLPTRDYYDIPGGYVEHGETPYQAAQREVFEELGIKPPIGRLLVADWWQDSPEADGGAKLLLIFDGGSVGQQLLRSIEVDDEEVASVELRNLADLEAVTIPRLANRIRQALVARGDLVARYLENGCPVL